MILEIDGVKVPHLILVQDPTCIYNGEILELEKAVRFIGDDFEVFMVKGKGPYDWMRPDRVRKLKYKDVSHLKAFV